MFDEDLNNTDLADKYYLLSININSNIGIFHTNYGSFLTKRKKYQEAEVSFRKGLDLYNTFQKPNDLSSAHFNFGNLLFKNLNKFQEAKQQYEFCINLNPKHFEANCNLAVLYKHTFKDLNKAEFYYNEAHKINPKDSITLNNLGNINSVKNKELAKHYYSQAILFDENYDMPYNGIGILLMNESPLEAKINFEKAIKLNFNNANAHFNFARLLKFNLSNDKKAAYHYEISGLINPFFKSMKNDKLFNIIRIKPNLL